TSSFCSAASSAATGAISGTAVAGLQFLQAGAFGFFDLFFDREFCARTSPGSVANNTAHKHSASARCRANAGDFVRRASVLERKPKNNGEQRALSVLRRSVRIFSQSVRISVRQYLDHPPVKVVHRMVHDRFESPVVLTMCLFNVVF